MTDSHTQEMPNVIKRFEQLWYGVVFLSAINILISLNQAPIGSTNGLPFEEMLGVAVFILILCLVVWLVTSVSRRRKPWAKWILIVLVCSGIAGHLKNPSFAFQDGQLAGILTWVSALLQLIAISLLFTPTATQWLSPKGTAAPALPSASTSPTPKNVISIVVVSVACVAGLAGAFAVFRLQQPGIPSCGSEIVANTLREIILEGTEKGASHQALLRHTRQAQGEATTKAQPFKLSIADHRERASSSSIRRCSADVQLGYDQQWLTDRIVKSSMSGSEKLEFRLASSLLGVNLSDRSVKINYTVQLTERGQAYVEIVEH